MKKRNFDKPASKSNIEAGNEISPRAQDLKNENCNNGQCDNKKRRSIDRNSK